MLIVILAVVYFSVQALHTSNIKQKEKLYKGLRYVSLSFSALSGFHSKLRYIQMALVLTICSLCFLARFIVFLYRPATGELMPDIVFYLFGYWLTEV